MKEELYIYTSSDERELLDIPVPSGITLKWVNNLFSDISKLTCSHSYTFKLPLTQRNIRLLDMANDIRHQSKMIRKRVRADFYINGVCLCPNANLYISEVSDTAFSCVLTWRVLKAFETLKSSSLKLNELPSVGNFEWKDGDSSLVYGYPTLGWKNTDNILYPAYDAGIPYETGTPPKPVVPVFRLIQMINDKFGVKFSIGQALTEGMGTLPLANFNNKNFHGKCVYDDYVTHGVVPITGVVPYLSDKYVAKDIDLINLEYAIQDGTTKQEGSYRRFTNEDDSTKYWREYEYWREIYVTNRHYWGGLASVKGYSERVDGSRDMVHPQWNTFIGSDRIRHQTKESSVSEELVEKLNMWKSSTNNGVNSGRYYGYEVYYAKREVEGYMTYNGTPNTSDLVTLKLEANCEIRGTASIVVQKSAVTAGRVSAPDYWWIYIVEAKVDENGYVKLDTYSDNGEDWIGLRSMRREESADTYTYYFDFGVEYIQRRINVNAVEEDSIGYLFWSGYEYTPPEDETRSLGDVYGDDWSSYNKSNGLMFGYDSSNANRQQVDFTDKFSRDDVLFGFLNIATITPSQDVVTKLPVEMNIIGNLPAISCFDFMKDVFYMNGAIPRVDKDGETVVAMYYNQLRDHIIAGESLNWSSKVVNGKNQSKMSKYESTNFGQRNIFEMAYSKRNKTEADLNDELEQYGDGYGTIGIADSLLDDEKVIFTSKFYPGLQKDIAYPLVKPGRTIKAWDGEKNVVTTTNPLYGFLNLRALDDSFEEIENVSKRPMVSNYGLDFKHIRMNAFEPFAEIDNIFGYLSSILENYTCVKEEMILTEMDLRNFDESVPVYLDKYNQFFAVSSIQRDKDGLSTVELVALPYIVPSYKKSEDTNIDTIFFSYALASTFLDFELDLKRTYTSNVCPLLYDIYVNSRNEEWQTTYNKLSEPLSGFSYYLSRWISPINDRWTGDPYTLKITVAEKVRYTVTKKKGYDTIYTETREAGIKVYYDDILLEPGTHIKTFTKAEDGQYHIIKVAFDIYNNEGELIEEYRKKLYYFVYTVDKSVINDDYGDEHQGETTVKVNGVNISGATTITSKATQTYTMNFTPDYANIKVQSVEVTANSNNVTVSDVSLDSFKLTPKNLPAIEETITLTIKATLTDGSSFEQTHQVKMQGMVLVIDGAGGYDAPNGTGSQSYTIYTDPLRKTFTIKGITSSNAAIKVGDITSNGFKLSAVNLAGTTTTIVTVIVECDGEELAATKEVTFTIKNSFDTSLLDSEGAMIVDINGSFYTKAEWKNAGILNDDADGVAVSDGIHRFVIAKNIKEIKIGGYTSNSYYDEKTNQVVFESKGTLVSNQFTTTSESEAITDFNGKSNTDAIKTQCSGTTVGEIMTGQFPSGVSSYLGTAGQWNIAIAMMSKINDLLNTIGGQNLIANYYALTSTQYDDKLEWYYVKITNWDGIKYELSRVTKGDSVETHAISDVREVTPIKIASLLVSGNDGVTGSIGTSQVLQYALSTSLDDAVIKDVSVTSSSDAVVVSDISTAGFKATVHFNYENKVKLTIKARVNGLTKIVEKELWVFVEGSSKIDTAKLDNATALIADTELNFYTKEEWLAAGRNNDDAEGVAFSNGTIRFLIAKNAVTYEGGQRFVSRYFGGNGVNITGLDDGKNDTGYDNTQKIIAAVTESDGYFKEEPYSAAAFAANYGIFHSGKKGYLPSIGEFEAISSSNVLKLIDGLLETIGGDKLITYGLTTYWTSSTYYDANYKNTMAYTWCQISDYGYATYGKRSVKNYIRIFRKLEK